MSQATPPTLQFLFDFGSPNAYLCHRVLPQMSQRCGLRLDYQPILLGGLFKLANNRSPMQAYADIPNKLAYEQLEMKRFIARHGLSKFKFNPNFPVNTLQLMRGALAARQLGCFEPYVEAVFVAMWEQGLKMDDPAVVAATLGAAGLDAAALFEASQQAEVKARLLADTQAAFDRGAFGVPSFFVGDQLYFGKERLVDIAQSIGCGPADKSPAGQ